MAELHQDLADWMQYTFTPFTGINGDFAERRHWKGHWKKRVYFEVRRGWPLFWNKEFQESMIWIHQIITPNVEDRGKGYMKEVMELWQYAAESWGCSLYLFPDPFEYISSNRENIWKYGTDEDHGIVARVGKVTSKELTQIYGRMGFVPLRSKVIPNEELRPWNENLEVPPYVQVYSEEAYRNGQRPMLWAGSYLHSKRITKFRLFGSELPEDGSCEHLRNLTVDPECLCDTPNFLDVNKFMGNKKVVAPG